MNLFIKIIEFKQQIFMRKKLRSFNIDYDAYWDNKGFLTRKMNNFQKFRFDYIKNRIRKNTSVKDLGVGEGNIIENLDNTINKIGIDITDRYFKELNKKNIKTQLIDFMNMNSTELPVTDYSILFEVLEHLSNSEEILMKVISSTKKKVFVSFPNTGYMSYRIRLLFGKFPIQWRYHPGEHLRFWTYSDLKWWLKELKLQDKSKIIIYEGIPILNKIIPSLFGEAFIIEISKE